MWCIIVAQNADIRVVAQTSACKLYLVRNVLGRFGESEMGGNGLKRLDKDCDQRLQLFLHDCNVQTSEMEQ